MNKVKALPKTAFDEIKRRRETVNVIESECKFSERYKSPKTGKKQSYLSKQIKAHYKEQHKAIKSLYTQCKKQHRVNSTTQYESNITPKKSLLYHVDSSQSKQKPLRKIQSISLVDTPKKLNLKKKSEQILFTVQQERDKKGGCKKVTSSSSKFSSKSSINKQLKLQSNKLLQSIEHSHHDNMKGSAIKDQKRHNDNYDNYYHEGVNNSEVYFKSSNKKVVKVQQNYTHNSSTGVEKQKSSRTLKITRNNTSSNRINNFDGGLIKKNYLINNLISSQNNLTKSQNKLNSPRVEQFETELYDNSSQLNEKRFQKMFIKCNLILKTYNLEMERLKGENESLRKQNQYLKNSLSQRKF